MKERNPIYKLDGFLVKKCNKCKNTYEISMFNKSSIKKSGLRGDCKQCQQNSRKEYSRNNYDSEKEYFYRMALQYGISKEDYYNMYNEQKGNCKICGIHQSKFSRRLHIDHCHKCGEVRGLLCVNCNTLLGYLKDNVDYIDAIKAYLEAK